MPTEFQALMIGIIGMTVINLFYFMYTIFCLDQLRSRLDAECVEDEQDG